jgi:thiol-disulfide isomerase/thioredoxin
MKNTGRRILVLLLLLHFSMQIYAADLKVQVVKMPWLDSVLQLNNDTTYVINFWATWCIPCVAELPDFEKAGLAFADQKVKVILISLDYEKKLKETVVPFLLRKKINSMVVLLNEPDANSWIEKVDANWSGALPATLIRNQVNSVRTFYEKELNFEELDKLIRTSINNSK